MITDEQFKDYINQLSDSYEEIKDAVYLTVHRTTDAMDINEKLAHFRDIACTLCVHNILLKTLTKIKYHEN